MSIFQLSLFSLIFVAVVYFVPTVVAFARGHHNRAAILLLNVFLGWTILGWIAALVWAAMNPAPLARTTSSDLIPPSKE